MLKSINSYWKTGLVLWMATCWQTSMAAGQSDHIRGGARADFGVNELQIPCVEITNLNPELDGKFFDVILDRRGNSMNFELKFAAVEDPALCQSIADFALFRDDVGTEPKVFVRCEIRPGRSKISVDVNNLVAGNYLAEVTSGRNRAASPTRVSLDDELEFHFDSQSNDIAQGAIAISADFIQGPVAAKIFDQANQVVAMIADVACISKPIGASLTTASRGAQLYAEHCASCHGATPDKVAQNAAHKPAKIRSAIQANKGGSMGVLQGRLSDADLDAIAIFLGGK